MIAKHYGESENPAAVERHLAACPPCAEAFRALRRDLADLDHIEAPPRPEEYGAQVWAAIAGSLPAYVPRPHSWFSSAWGSPWIKALGYAAACAVLVSSAFHAGRLWQQKQTPTTPLAHSTPQTGGAAQQPRQPIVVVVLDDHLDRSERFLVELKHADLDSSAMVSPMRDEARSLLAANRVCRKNVAQQAADPELATALDHLDSLLAEAANEPGGLNAQAIAQLQQKMNAEGLLFEVRVLRSRIAHRDETHPDKGGTI